MPLPRLTRQRQQPRLTRLRQQSRPRARQRRCCPARRRSAAAGRRSAGGARRGEGLVGARAGGRRPTNIPPRSARRARRAPGGARAGAGARRRAPRSWPRCTAAPATGAPGRRWRRWRPARTRATRPPTCRATGRATSTWRTWRWRRRRTTRRSAACRRGRRLGAPPSPHPRLRRGCLVPRGARPGGRPCTALPPRGGAGAAGARGRPTGCAGRAGPGAPVPGQRVGGGGRGGRAVQPAQLRRGAGAVRGPAGARPAPHRGARPTLTLFQDLLERDRHCVEARARRHASAAAEHAGVTRRAVLSLLCSASHVIALACACSRGRPGGWVCLRAASDQGMSAGWCRRLVPHTAGGPRTLLQGPLSAAAGRGAAASLHAARRAWVPPRGGRARTGNGHVQHIVRVRARRAWTRTAHG